MNKIRVLLADDHAVLRSGLRMIIDGQPDMEVVGEASTNYEALSACNRLLPDVLVQDLSLPDGSGVATIAHVAKQCPNTRVVVLSLHDEVSYMRAALAAGAVGYVAKAAADTELLSAIRAVANNRMFVDLKSNPSAMQEALLAEAKPPRTVNSLSSREREVLALLAQGFTNQEAADRLFLSVKTVETYRNRVGTKLGLRSRADYVRYAVEMGLLAPGKSAPEADQPPEQSP